MRQREAYWGTSTGLWLGSDHNVSAPTHVMAAVILEVPFNLKYQAHAFPGIQCSYVSLKFLWEATWLLFWFGSWVFTMFNWSPFAFSCIWFSGSLWWEGSRPVLLANLIHIMTATSAWDSLAMQLVLMHLFLRQMILRLQLACSTTPSPNRYTRSMEEEFLKTGRYIWMKEIYLCFHKLHRAFFPLCGK